MERILTEKALHSWMDVDYVLQPSSFVNSLFDEQLVASKGNLPTLYRVIFPIIKKLARLQWVHPGNRCILAIIRYN